MSNDPKFDHIDLADKQKVLNECVETPALPKHATPALLCADVKKKAEALDKVCRPVMMKPKPKPAAAPESPSPASSQGGGNSQSQSEYTKHNANATVDTAGSAAKEAPSAEPMDTDKSDEGAPETSV